VAGVEPVVPGRLVLVGDLLLQTSDGLRCVGDGVGEGVHADVGRGRPGLRLGQFSQPVRVG
jgi:hypothetical protein